MRRDFGVAQGKIPVLGADVVEGQYYSREGDGFAKVGQVDATHPVMAAAAPVEVVGVAAGGKDSAQDSSGWPDLKFYYASRVDAEKMKARVVARLGDGTPLLMDKQLGEGHVLLFTSGFENLTNDLPLQPAFVPFVDQAARYLSGEDRLGGSRMVDSFVQLRTAESAQSGAAQAGKGVEVVDPDGKRPLSLTEAATIQSYQLTKSGFLSDAVCEWEGCADCSESGPAGVGPGCDSGGCAGALEWDWKSGTQPAESASGAAIVTKEAPLSLWWWVMLLALAVAVAESMVASRLSGYAAGGSMSRQNELNLYIRRVQERLRLGAWVRGAAILMACGAADDAGAGDDFECVCVSRSGG